MADVELLRVIQRLNELELDWGDMGLEKAPPESGTAQSSNGYNVCARYDSGLSSISINDLSSHAEVFEGKYKERDVDYSNSPEIKHDPASAEILRSWIREQLGRAFDSAQRRKEDSRRRFFEPK